MKDILLSMVVFYRRHVSPFLKPSCRYTPSCSRYAYEAIERYGAIGGSWLAIKRILRCNPLFPPGYDPVPERPERPHTHKDHTYT